MEKDELLRRAEDLHTRCERSGIVTNSFFLTPAEQMTVQNWARYGTDCTIRFSGGSSECERQAAFFLPDYLDEECFDVSEYISAISVKAGFGEPGHRDYLGAILGLGIRREWVGDIRIFGSTAYVFCLKSVERHLLDSLDKVGHFGVKTAKVSLAAVPVPERKVKQISFTVKSMRLDAVAAGMFSLSRTECAKRIGEGVCSLNYEPCMRTDAPIRGGDIISLRGYGKGTVSASGGVSRKGRLFVDAEILK